MALIVGIDPGFTGAIALLDPGLGRLQVFDMPVFKDPKGRTVTNLHALGTVLRPELDEVNPEVTIAIIEQVHAMKGQGVSSTFRFGQCYGAIQMAATGHGYEVHDVTPQAWKKHFRLSRDKGVSRSLASQRFPRNAEQFKRVMDDGRAEAALIALYGAEVLLPKHMSTQQGPST